MGVVKLIKVSGGSVRSGMWTLKTPSGAPYAQNGTLYCYKLSKQQSKLNEKEKRATCTSIDFR